MVKSVKHCILYALFAWLQHFLAASVIHKYFCYLSKVNPQIMKEMRYCFSHELTSFLLALYQFKIKRASRLIATMYMLYASGLAQGVGIPVHNLTTIMYDVYIHRKTHLGISTSGIHFQYALMLATLRVCKLRTIVILVCT